MLCRSLMSMHGTVAAHRRKNSTFQLRQLEELKLQQITIATMVLQVQNPMKGSPDIRSVREKNIPQDRHEYHRPQLVVVVTFRQLIG